MLMAASVDVILDKIAELSLEDQEMLDEIVRKRVIESRRTEIYDSYISAKNDHDQGLTKKGTAADLFGNI